MTSDEVQKLSKFIAYKHQENGGGIYRCEGGRCFEVLADPDSIVAFDDLAVEVEGSQLREKKDIRALLYRTKQGDDKNLLDDENVVVWSLYDPILNVSVLGVALTSAVEQEV